MLDFKVDFRIYKPISNFLNIFQNTKNKMKKIGALLTFFFTFFTTVHSAYNSTGPTWLPSPYFRAGNNRVIITKTAAGQQTYYTFTFSSALSGIPNLAYGVKNYRGKQSFKCRLRYDADRKFLNSEKKFNFIIIYSVNRNFWDYKHLCTDSTILSNRSTISSSFKQF